MNLYQKNALIAESVYLFRKIINYFFFLAGAFLAGAFFTAAFLTGTSDF